MKHCEARSDPAPALTRGLDLLKRLDVDGPATLERLTQVTGWPKSSVARILESLACAQAVQRDPSSRRYRTCLRLVTIAAMDEYTLRQAAAHAMDALCQTPNPTIELYAWQDEQLTMIDRRESAQAVVSVRARIGWVRDLTEMDALSQVVRAFHGKDFHALAPGGWVWQQGEKQTLSQGQVDRVVEHVRDTRSGIDLGINEYGVRRYASPLFKQGSLVGVLGMAQICSPRDTQPAPEMTRVLGAAAQQVHFL